MRTIALLFLMMLSAIANPALACCTHMPPEICCERQPRDLAAGATPRAVRAAESWDSLWKLISHPKTTFLERLFLARQAPGVFPVDRLPFLMGVLGQLEAEEDLHNWGLKAVNRSNAFDMEGAFPRRNTTWLNFMKSLPGAERRRKLLGYSWVLPRSQTGESPPGGWKSYEAAPWPLQVQQALWRLLGECKPRERTAQERWIQVAMTMPGSTEREASLFVASVSGVPKSLGAMERLRRILIEPRFRLAAWLLAAQLPGDSLDLEGAELQDLGQIFLLDLLSSPQDRHLKSEGTRGGRALKASCDPSRGRPCNAGPATLILELSRRATDGGQGSDYERFYGFVLPIQELVDRPFLPESVSPRNELEAEKALEQFGRWLAVQKADLELKASVEAPRLAAMRLRLSAAAQTEGGFP